MSNSFVGDQAPDTSAITANTARIAIETNATMSAKVKETEAPAVFSSTNTTYRMIHQTQTGSSKANRLAVTPLA